MGWTNWLVETFAGPVIAAKVQEQIANLGAIRKEDEKFRRLSTNPQRDLLPLAQDRQAEIAYYLWKTNSLASRMLNLKRDLVIGDGFRFSADNDDVGEVLERFWNDGVNQMDLTLDQRVLELGLYGEQCYPVFVTPHMGRVRLGYLDPTAIETIWPDPENAALLLGVETKQETAGGKRRYAVILDEDAEAVLSPAGRQVRHRFSDGSCFLFSVNRALNATRGSSDLLPVLDWLDAYENWLFDRLEWASQLGAYIWDVLLKGMNADQIRQWLTENPPPKRGSIRAHNENVTWNAVVADLKAADLTQMKQVFLHHILSAEGWPEWYFTSGGDVNRATAAEMGDPILKSLSRRQKLVSFMLTFQGRYALRQAVNAGLLREKVPVTRKSGQSSALRRPQEDMVPAVQAFKVDAPEISGKDISRVSQALASTSAALLLGQQNRWITAEDAAGVFALLTSMLGREVEAAPQESRHPSAVGGQPGEEEAAAMLAAVREKLGHGAGNGAGQGVRGEA